MDQEDKDKEALQEGYIQASLPTLYNIWESHMLIWHLYWPCTDLDCIVFSPPCFTLRRWNDNLLKWLVAIVVNENSILSKALKKTKLPCQQCTWESHMLMTLELLGEVSSYNFYLILHYVHGMIAFEKLVSILANENSINLKP